MTINLENTLKASILLIFQCVFVMRLLTTTVDDPQNQKFMGFANLSVFSLVTLNVVGASYYPPTIRSDFSQVTYKFSLVYDGFRGYALGYTCMINACMERMKST